MKLYTEEEVVKLLDKYTVLTKIGAEFYLNKMNPIELPSDSLCINCDESKSTHNVCMDCMIKIAKENIELPSDEEIHDECQIGGMDTNQQLCFSLGAKWMRDKIQGGNK